MDKRKVISRGCDRKIWRGSARRTVLETGRRVAHVYGLESVNALQHPKVCRLLRSTTISLCRLWLVAYSGEGCFDAKPCPFEVQYQSLVFQTEKRCEAATDSGSCRWLDFHEVGPALKELRREALQLMLLAERGVGKLVHF